MERGSSFLRLCLTLCLAAPRLLLLGRALFESCKQSVIQAPSPLAKSLARNTKFNQTKFNIFKMWVWADKFENLPLIP